MKLYFARHGQTAMNAGGASSNSTNEPLTDIGLQQAAELAEGLRGVPFDAIISSPLQRAYQTAEVVNRYHNLPIVTDPVWRERDAKTYVDVRFWDDIFDFDKNIQLEGSESLKKFFERVYAAIDELKQRYGDKTVLVVSHGGVQHALYAYANNLPWAGNMRLYPVKNCEYRVYDL